MVPVTIGGGHHDRFFRKRFLGSAHPAAHEVAKARPTSGASRARSDGVRDAALIAELMPGVGARGDALGGAAGGGAAEIGAGVGALKDALSDGAIDPIEAGMLAMQGAVGGSVPDDIKSGMDALAGAIGGGAGGSPEEIKDGLTKLREAFGPDVGADEMKATLEKLKGAFGADISGPIEEGLGALRDSLGTGGNGATDGLLTAAEQLSASFGATSGLTGTVDTLKAALGEGDGVTGAAADLAGKLRDDLGSSADDVANALRGQFSDGLTAAERAARNLAEAFAAFQLPGAATGGVFGGAMAVVGERGPEVVNALPGGGFRVTPITFAQMDALLGDGIPGFANGGVISGPVGGGGGSGSGPHDVIAIGKKPRGWGSGGPIINDPRDPRHPDYVDPRDQGASDRDHLAASIVRRCRVPCSRDVH